MMALLGRAVSFVEGGKDLKGKHAAQQPARLLCQFSSYYIPLTNLK